MLILIFIVGKQATKGQPKKAAAKEPAQKKQKKGSEPDQAQNQVIHDDCIPDEMKASTQRMLAFLKYRADGNKNKSGQNLAEAQRCLEAMEFKIVFHAFHVFFGSSGLSQDWRFRQTRIYPGLPDVRPQGPQVDAFLCQEGNQL